MSATEAAAKFLEQEGWTVYAPGDDPLIRPRDDEAQLLAQWQQVQSILTMSADMVEAGARLRLINYFKPGIDPRPLARSGMLRLIDRILKTAVVMERENA